MPTASYRDSGACRQGLDAVLELASFALQYGQSPALKKKKARKKKKPLFAERLHALFSFIPHVPV